MASTPLQKDNPKQYFKVLNWGLLRAAMCAGSLIVNYFSCRKHNFSHSKPTGQGRALLLHCGKYNNSTSTSTSILIYSIVGLTLPDFVKSQSEMFSSLVSLLKSSRGFQMKRGFEEVSNEKWVFSRVSNEKRRRLLWLALTGRSLLLPALSKLRCRLRPECEKRTV